MEINAASTASRETELNKTNVGFDILSKTIEKTTETKDLPQNRQAEKVAANESETGHLIDTYA